MRASLTLSSLVFGTALSIATAGCGGGATGTGPGARHADHARNSGAASDGAFASSVHDRLLAPPGSAQRSSLLGGVEARQMERVVARFHGQGGEDRALVSLIGGLYLIRTGELGDDLLGPAGRNALLEGARRLAARG